MLIIMAAVVAVLGYQKFLEIQVQITQGSQQPPPTSVTVATAEPAKWGRQVKAIGTLDAFQGVDITTEVPGIIQSINFDSGDEIQKDTLLIELDNRTEMANLESAQARYDSDNSQYQRLLQLRDESFVTKNDIDTQASLVDISEANVNVAMTALSKKRVFAPFSGKLGIRQVDVGEYITPGAPIVTLLSLDRLYLDFTLPERNFNDLIVDQPITFTVRAFPERTFTARVATWDPELDPSTRNINVRAIVNNRERLLAPGMFADMTVQSKRSMDVLTLPETAIFYNIYGEAVYVLEAQEGTEQAESPDYRLAARQVDVAYRSNGQAGIVSGIKVGDLAVTAGQLKLYPSLRVAIVDDVPEYNAAAQ